MIFDFSRIKGIVLIRLPSTKAGQAPALRAQDVMPLMTLGSTDASQWRPDGTMAQNSERSTSVAQAPLASGTQMANHARSNPRRETFEAILTDTPILPTTIAFAAVGLHRADSLLTALYAIHDSRALVAFVSATSVIETAIITAIGTPRAPGEGSAYTVSVSIEEVRTFSLKTISSIDDAAARLGANKLASAGGVVIGT